jgi:hypothetical protein
MANRVTAILFTLATTMTTTAAAQSTPDPDLNQSIGAGPQWALPHTGDDAIPGFQVSWRRWFSPHFGLGSDFRWWRNTRTSEINSPTQTGPGGIPIPAQLGQDDRQTSSYGFGVGLLAKASAGRLSVIAGAGPGFFVDRTVHDTRINDMRSVGEITEQHIGIHMLAEVEVRATHRVSMFAGLTVEQRDLRVLDSQTGYPTAGVRFAF